jgi:hypothetical protein
MYVLKKTDNYFYDSLSEFYGCKSVRRSAMSPSCVNMWQYANINVLHFSFTKLDRGSLNNLSKVIYA